MAKQMCLVVSGLLIALCGGCPEVIPPPLDVWLESSRPVSADGKLYVYQGEQVKFTAHATGGYLPYFTYRWGVSNEIQTRFNGYYLDHTFTEPGEFVVEVNLVDQELQEKQAHIDVVVIETVEPSVCLLDEECGVGRHCEGGVCVLDSQDSGCPPDCGFGKHCENGTCVPDQPTSPECDSDSDCPAGKHCDNNGTCVDDTPPVVPGPIIDYFTVNGSSGQQTFTADASGNTPQLLIRWKVRNAWRVVVAGAPNFDGERGEEEIAGEKVTLNLSRDGANPSLSLTATNTAGVSVTKTVNIHIVGGQTDRLRITSVTFSPASPFHRQDRTTITIRHTGSGRINYLLPPSNNVIASVQADTDGETCFDHVWASEVTCNDPDASDCSSKFWPDGFPNEVTLVSTIVNR